MEGDNFDYNSEPVYYCKHCLSLLIMDGGFIDYCDNCGSTDVEKATLEEYDALRLKRFGKKLFFK